MREGVECPRCGGGRVSVERLLVDPDNKRPAQESGWINWLLATFGGAAFYALVVGPIADTIATVLQGPGAEYLYRAALGMSVLAGVAMLLVLEYFRRHRVGRSVEVFKFVCQHCGHRWGFRGASSVSGRQLASKAWPSW